MSWREEDLGGWKLVTFGDFQLSDAAGQAVALSHRKVEALLAVLAVHREFGIEREEVAEILWPARAPEKKLTNLRQTISLLKRSLGQEALDISRSHVRLSSSLGLRCDYDVPTMRAGSIFMPGHEGDWFDTVRMEYSPDEELPLLQNTRRSVVGNFQESVEMLALVDSRGSFDLLRTNPSLTRGLAYPVLRSILDGYGHLEFAKGWIDFWRGTATEDLFQAMNFLRSAMREAKRTSDYELASEASLELGRAYCRTGNVAKAERMCNISETLADLLKTREARATADRLRGTHLVNWEDSKQGLLLIQKAEDMTDNSMGRTHLTAVHSFFAASAGENRRAADLLDSLANTAPILGGSSTLWLMGLSRSLLTISGGRPTDAIPELEQISRRSTEAESTQMAVYAEELLMRIYDRSGDKKLSRSRMQSAHQGRKKSQMFQTPMEARRLTFV